MGQHFVMMECGTLAHSDVCFRTSAPRAPVNYWRGPVSRGHNTNINPNCKPYPYRGYIVDVRNGSFEGAAAGARSRLRSYGLTDILYIHSHPKDKTVDEDIIDYLRRRCLSVC